MLHDAPPGTGLILSIIGIVMSLFLVIALVYSWFILQSQNLAMSITGFIVFIVIMVVVGQTRARDDDNDDNDLDEEESPSMYDDI